MESHDSRAAARNVPASAIPADKLPTQIHSHTRIHSQRSRTNGILTVWLILRLRRKVPLDVFVTNDECPVDPASGIVGDARFQHGVAQIFHRIGPRQDRLHQMVRHVFLRVPKHLPKEKGTKQRRSFSTVRISLRSCRTINRTISGGRYIEGTFCSTRSRLLHMMLSSWCSGPWIILVAGRSESISAYVSDSAVSKPHVSRPLLVFTRSYTLPAVLMPVSTTGMLLKRDSDSICGRPECCRFSCRCTETMNLTDSKKIVLRSTTITTVRARARCVLMLPPTNPSFQSEARSLTAASDTGTDAFPYALYPIVVSPPRGTPGDRVCLQTDRKPITKRNRLQLVCATVDHKRPVTTDGRKTLPAGDHPAIVVRASRKRPLIKLISNKFNRTNVHADAFRRRSRSGKIM